jgi:hypothetical protein
MTSSLPTMPAKPLSGPIGDEADRTGAPGERRPGDAHPGVPGGAFPHDSHDGGPQGEPREPQDDIISQPGGHRDDHMDRANRPPAERDR